MMIAVLAVLALVAFVVVVAAQRQEDDTLMDRRRCEWCGRWQVMATRVCARCADQAASDE